MSIDFQPPSPCIAAIHRRKPIKHQTSLFKRNPPQSEHAGSSSLNGTTNGPLPRGKTEKPQPGTLGTLVFGATREPKTTGPLPGQAGQRTSKPVTAQGGPGGLWGETVPEARMARGMDGALIRQESGDGDHWIRGLQTIGST